jgi:maltooligosyltrehalose synthase
MNDLRAACVCVGILVSQSGFSQESLLDMTTPMTTIEAQEESLQEGGESWDDTTIPEPSATMSGAYEGELSESGEAVPLWDRFEEDPPAEFEE